MILLIQTYFLGANSADGFCSCYDSFCSGNQDFLYIIKGGPGCGKSTFMKKIGAAAEKLGLDVHYVRCSGDPDSLDGVYLPQFHLGYVDGTAPHVIEPANPGVSGCYLDFSQFFDLGALYAVASDIRNLNAAYKAAYQKAYSCLAAHRKDRGSNIGSVCRLRHAVTCQGIVTLPAPATPMLISNADLNALAERKDVIRYLHPLFTEQVIGIYCETTDEYFEAPLTLPACDDAISHLCEAKQLHDKLEARYRPYVDFNGIDNLLATHKKALSERAK